MSLSKFITLALRMALLQGIAATPLLARTIMLKLDAFAVLSEKNSTNGWAANHTTDAFYCTSNPPLAGVTTSCLLRYSLAQIPKGQRITHAEWTIAHRDSQTTVHVWRLLADWGLGVCYQYRMTYPEKLEWSVAGARGKSIDCTFNQTATGQFVNGKPFSVNVTQDVEMWYSGATKNRGWLLTFDGPADLRSPTHGDVTNQWRLMITYEPE